MFGFAFVVALGTCGSVDAINLANSADTMMSTNLDEAIDRLSRATKLDPSNPRIFFKLARALVKKERWKDAASAATSAASLAPTWASYHALAGHALVRDGAWRSARVALETAVRLDPNDADAHFDLATTDERLQDEQEALVHYTLAIRAAPSSSDVAYTALADLYRRLGYADQALAVVREGLAWSPSPHAHFVLATLAGAIAEEKKAMPEAVARYQEAKDVCGACNDRGEAIAFFNLGMVLASVKPVRKAEARTNLVAFQKMICKGGAAMRFADECTQTQEVLMRLGQP